ncbi:hypothetical protein HY745_06665, partial [Candidatus Desantisbacteria bacterium]|nr:hypothetical protein [Candidatus Desantisbacteria bacterium]
IKFALLISVAISLLLAAVHFLRDDLVLFAVIYLFLLVIFLFLHKPVTVKIIQPALIIAACEWGRTTFVLVSFRIQDGDSWTRLAIILLSVASFTFVSAFAFRNKSIKELYGSKQGVDGTSG